MAIKDKAADAAKANFGGAWENQRYYYAFGWHAPLPLDGPSYWTSLTGEPLEEALTPIGTLAHHAEDANSDHELQHWADEWVVEVTPATDPQDFVRRRKWLKRSQVEGDDDSSRPPLESSSSRTFVSAGDAMHVTAASAAAADDTRRSNTTTTARTAAKAFFSMLQDAARRRGGGLMSIPWDPMSWGSVYSEHSTWLANTQAMLLPHRLRPSLKAQKTAGAEAASAAAVAHEGDATLAVSHDPCTTSRSLDERHAAPLATAAAATDPLSQGRPATPAANGSAADARGPGEGNGSGSTQTQQQAGDGGEGRRSKTAAADGGLELEEALLEDMQAAVDFSRAAYGYAFLCGGMSSIARYLHMQTVQRSTFDIISGVSAEANTQALCAAASIPMRDVLLAEWNNTTYRPCHAIAIDRKRQRFVLTVRGSLEIGDLLTDLHAKPIAVHLPCLDGEAHVHEGMLRAAAYVHCNTAETLARASAEHPDWPLFVTGHSLGGGVAALVAVLLRQPGGAPEKLQENGISCVTVGTGSSMCAPLADACAGFVASLVLGSDAVPRLSHHTVENLLDELIRKSPALNFAETVRSSVASTFAPRPAAAAAAEAGAASAPDAVQLAELPKGDGFSALDLGEGGRGAAADSPYVKAAKDAAEMGERGVHASMLVADEDDGGEDEEEAAMVADGMATAKAETPVRADEEGSVWLRLLRPVEGLIRGAREQQTPFSPEALRAYAQRWREKAAAAAAEPGPDADLAGVSVADPLRYLSESGISRSGRAADEAVAAIEAPAPELQRPLPSAPSGIRKIDADVLREADAGHKAAAAADAAPPPPLYPPGRVLWLIPLRRKAAPNGSMDVEIASSTALVSCPKILTAAEVFKDDAAPAIPQEAAPPAEAEAEEALSAAIRSQIAPMELEDRQSDSDDRAPAAGGTTPEDPTSRTNGNTPGDQAEPRTQGRSLFIQLAGDAMLGSDAVPASSRQGPDTGATPSMNGAAGRSSRTLSGPSAAQPQRQDGLTQAGADVASGAFERGLEQQTRSDSSGSWGDGEEGGNGAGGAGTSGKAGEEVAPNWLLSFVRRPLGGGGGPAQAAEPPAQGAGGGVKPEESAGSPIKTAGSAGATRWPDAAAEAAGKRGRGSPTVGSDAAGSPASAKAKADEGAAAVAAEGDGEAAAGQSQFVLEDSDGGEPEGGGGDASVHDLAVLDVTHQRDVFNYLTLGADMIQDHLPDSYTKAVALLKRHARQERAAAEAPEPAGTRQN